MRSIAVSAGVLMASALLVAPAGAATLHGENGIVTYTASPGHDNIAQFEQTGPTQIDFMHPGHMSVSGSEPNDGDEVIATGTCRRFDRYAATEGYRCNDITIGVTADTGDGDDELWTGTDTLSMRMYGGEGNDLLNGGAGTETLDGGPGDDTLVAIGGADSLIGGPGTDIARFYSHVSPPVPMSITLDGIANDGTPGDRADVRPDVENISAVTEFLPRAGFEQAPEFGPSFAPLRIVGDAGPNELTAYSPATLIGGDGPDTLNGSPFDDTFDSVDGFPDVVNCLDGNDSANVDGQDTVSPDCEIVTVAAAPAPTTMTLAVRAARRARFTVSGRVVRPRHMTAQRACRGGRVRISVTARKRRVATRTARLRADCSYRRTFAVRRSLRGKLRFGARYAGNSVLATTTAKAVTARVRR